MSVVHVSVVICKRERIIMLLSSVGSSYWRIICHLFLSNTETLRDTASFINSTFLLLSCFLGKLSWIWLPFVCGFMQEKYSTVLGLTGHSYTPYTCFLSQHWAVDLHHLKCNWNFSLQVWYVLSVWNLKFQILKLVLYKVELMMWKCWNLKEISLICLSFSLSAILFRY